MSLWLILYIQIETLDTLLDNFLLSKTSAVLYSIHILLWQKQNIATLPDTFQLADQLFNQIFQIIFWNIETTDTLLDTGTFLLTDRDPGYFIRGSAEWSVRSLCQVSVSFNYHGNGFKSISTRHGITRYTEISCFISSIHARVWCRFNVSAIRGHNSKVIASLHIDIY